MKRHEADPFLQGYIDAALFTTDPSPPSGVDYVTSGRAAELWPKLPDYFIERAKKDVAAFTSKACLLLAQLGDPCSNEQAWRNGSDFWYTRNGHGVGFWDRGYPDEIADPLTELCHGFGEVHDFSAEDFGLTTKE